MPVEDKQKINDEAAEPAAKKLTIAESQAHLHKLLGGYIDMYVEVEKADVEATQRVASMIFRNPFQKGQTASIYAQNLADKYGKSLPPESKEEFIKGVTSACKWFNEYKIATGGDRLAVFRQTRHEESDDLAAQLDSQLQCKA